MIEYTRYYQGLQGVAILQKSDPIRRNLNYDKLGLDDFSVPIISDEYKELDVRYSRLTTLEERQLFEIEDRKITEALLNQG